MNIENLLFWKHKEKGHVLKQECLAKLPKPSQTNYYQTTEQPTHHYQADEKTDYITPIIMADIISDNSSSVDSSPSTDSSPSFEGFDGGDFGGGGSSDSWVSSSDSSSSYDSGSSYDSSSSDSSSY